MTVTITSHDVHIETDAAATRSEIHISRSFVNPWGTSQPATQTFGVPAEPGEGARRAVRRFGTSLRELADN